ncbi:hypothetical protein FISHEDRAFT_77304 [Fistulina hepatica ATCC 64428]|uniref:Uncharacterized protein n=1 Tax=Fistulina hepatica ATCC 64428 TaxID=1128425 RepID=A0A0D7A1J0_9AGAR|nr:hypothetical protein FISHEDRAFT_77304 [Fistulina hepatica ATCC 64428]
MVCHTNISSPPTSRRSRPRLPDHHDAESIFERRRRNCRANINCQQPRPTNHNKYFWRGVRQSVVLIATFIILLYGAFTLYAFAFKTMTNAICPTIPHNRSELVVDATTCPAPVQCPTPVECPAPIRPTFYYTPIQTNDTALHEESGFYQNLLVRFGNILELVLGPEMPDPGLVDYCTSAAYVDAPGCHAVLVAYRYRYTVEQLYGRPEPALISGARSWLLRQFLPQKPPIPHWPSTESKNSNNRLYNSVFAIAIVSALARGFIRRTVKTTPIPHQATTPVQGGHDATRSSNCLNGDQQKIELDAQTETETSCTCAEIPKRRACHVHPWRFSRRRSLLVPAAVRCSAASAASFVPSAVTLPPIPADTQTILNPAHTLTTPNLTHTQSTPAQALSVLALTQATLANTQPILAHAELTAARTRSAPARAQPVPALILSTPPHTLLLIARPQDILVSSHSSHSAKSSQADLECVEGAYDAALSCSKVSAPVVQASLPTSASTTVLDRSLRSGTLEMNDPSVSPYVLLVAASGFSATKFYLTPSVFVGKYTTYATVGRVHVSPAHVLVRFYPPQSWALVARSCTAFSPRTLEEAFIHMPRGAALTIGSHQTALVRMSRLGTAANISPLSPGSEAFTCPLTITCATPDASCPHEALGFFVLLSVLRIATWQSNYPPHSLPSPDPTDACASSPLEDAKLCSALLGVIAFCSRLLIETHAGKSSSSADKSASPHSFLFYDDGSVPVNRSSSTASLAVEGIASVKSDSVSAGVVQLDPSDVALDQGAYSSGSKGEGRLGDPGGLRVPAVPGEAGSPLQRIVPLVVARLPLDVLTKYVTLRRIRGTAAGPDIGYERAVERLMERQTRDKVRRERFEALCRPLVHATLRHRQARAMEILGEPTFARG